MENSIKVVYVTLSELNDVLANITIADGMGAFANVEQRTKPKTLKKDRITREAFTGLIEKQSVVSIILNTEYESVVVNQLAREGKESSEYVKGANTMVIDKSKSNNNFFGEYKGKEAIKEAIEYKPNANEKSKPKTQYFLNGVLTEKSSLPDVLPTPSSATNQGTEKEIQWRKLYTENILTFTFNKVKYVRTDI